MTRLITTALLAALATSAYCSYLSSCRRKRQQSPAKPEHIRTWEEEGGGVPVSENKTAAQVEPHSKPPMTSSQPYGATPVAPSSQLGLEHPPGSVPFQFGS